MSGAPEADDYIAGGSIRWSDLAATSVGTLATVVAIGIAEMFGLLATGLTASLSTLGTALGGVIAVPYLAANEAIQTAWMSAAEWLSVVSVFAFPVAVLMVATSVLLVLWGVNRFVQ